MEMTSEALDMKTLAAVLLAMVALSGCVVVPAYDAGYRGYGYGYYDQGYPYYARRSRYRHY